MIEKKLAIRNKLGIHLRPAAQFAQLVSKYQSSVRVSNDQGTVDGKSIMGLMMIAAGAETVINLVIDGPDEEEVFCLLKSLVEEKKFDEE